MRKAGRAISFYSVLKNGSPQAALLMLDCDRSLASHRYTSNVNDAEDGDDSDSDSDDGSKQKMQNEIADDALSQPQRHWILSPYRLPCADWW
jgi:hypothetical protein